MVQLEVTDIQARIKHIEKLIKENHPQWLVIRKCEQLKDRVDSFENLSKDLTTKSNQMNTSLQLTIHDPKTDESKKNQMPTVIRNPPKICLETIRARDHD